MRMEGWGRADVAGPAALQQQILSHGNGGKWEGKEGEGKGEVDGEGRGEAGRGRGRQGEAGGGRGRQGEGEGRCRQGQPSITTTSYGNILSLSKLPAKES